MRIVLAGAACLLAAHAASAAFLDDIEVEPGPDTLHHAVKDAEVHDLLRALLDDDEPADRMEGLNGLAAVADPADHAVVVGACRDRDARVRAQAWRIAARLGAAVPADRVEEALADADPVVRAACLSALPHLEMETGAAIEDLLDDPDTRVRGAAFACAVALDDDHAALAERMKTETSRNLRAAFLGQLFAAGKADRADLLAWGAAAAEDPLLTAAVLHALADGDAMADQTLREALGSRFPMVQEAAVKAATRLGNEAAKRESLALLPQADSSLRKVVCRAAATLQGDDVVETLLALALQDTDHQVRTEVCDALFAIHSPAALDALDACSRQSDLRLRVTAIQRIGEWGDQEPATRLFGFLAENEPDVVEATLEALMKLRHPGIADYKDRLVELIDFENGAAAGHAIRAAGFIGNREVLPKLSEILHRITHATPWQRRQAALEVMILFGHADEVRRVIALATERVVPPPPGVPAGPTHDYPLVRVEAIRYLALFADDPTKEGLHDRFDDVPPTETRIMLLRYMKHLTGEDYELVPSHRVANYLVDSLAKYPFASVKPPGIRKREDKAD